MKNQLAQVSENLDSGAILEKVMLGTDLSSLTPLEKVAHIRNICKSLKLNPVTTPIKLMKFNGKEIPYFAKEATEQLREIRNISIKIVENKIIDDLYIVVAEASSPEGRIDSSTGAVFIGGLKGEAKAIAIMKAETKAKRRVTLSICGLGFNDESEMDFAKPKNDYSTQQKQIDHVVKEINPIAESIMLDFDDFLAAIEKCETKDQLKAIFDEVKKYDFRSQPALLRKLIDAKDEKKNDLILKEMGTVDVETGEVTHE